MNISMHFDGYVEQVIDEAVKRGVAKTKAEAIRLGLLELDERFRLVRNAEEKLELESDLREVSRIEREMRSGQEKVHKAKSVEDLLK